MESIVENQKTRNSLFERIRVLLFMEYSLSDPRPKTFLRIIFFCSVVLLWMVVSSTVTVALDVWSLERGLTTSGSDNGIVLVESYSERELLLPVYSTATELLKPTIAGYPETISMVKIPYSTFTPTQCDPVFPSTCNATSFGISGTLPPGLNFDSTTGTIRGTPTTAGIYKNLVITAINDVGSSSLQAFSIAVSPEIKSFISGTSIGTARQDHTSTLLPNGKVLVLGGAGVNSAILSSAELYDPADGSWMDAGSMTEARKNHSATLLQNGKVLVAGGIGINSDILSSAELYSFDPVSCNWSSAGTSVMKNPRSSHTATVLSDGNVLVIGGAGSDYDQSTSVELYNPNNNSWTAATPMIEEHYGNTATLLTDGKVMVVGGGDLNSAELYDPQNDPLLYPQLNPHSKPWSNPWFYGNLPIRRSGHTATVLPGGKVLLAGGVDEFGRHISNAELYDPITGSWSATGSMATRRQFHTATILSDGMVLVSGGNHNDKSLMPFAELYNPVRGVWKIAGVLAAPRYGHTATMLENEKVLVVGGTSGLSPLASIELFKSPVCSGVTSDD